MQVADQGGERVGQGDVGSRGVTTEAEGTSSGSRGRRLLARVSSRHSFAWECPLQGGRARPGLGLRPVQRERGQQQRGQHAPQRERARARVQGCPSSALGAATSSRTARRGARREAAGHRAMFM